MVLRLPPCSVMDSWSLAAVVLAYLGIIKAAARTGDSFVIANG